MAQSKDDAAARLNDGHDSIIRAYNALIDFCSLIQYRDAPMSRVNAISLERRLDEAGLLVENSRRQIAWDEKNSHLAAAMVNYSAPVRSRIDKHHHRWNQPRTWHDVAADLIDSAAIHVDKAWPCREYAIDVKKMSEEEFLPWSADNFEKLRLEVEKMLADLRGDALEKEQARWTAATLGVVLTAIDPNDLRAIDFGAGVASVITAKTDGAQLEKHADASQTPPRSRKAKRKRALERRVLLMLRELQVLDNWVPVYALREAVEVNEYSLAEVCNPLIDDGLLKTNGGPLPTVKPIPLKTAGAPTPPPVRIASIKLTIGGRVKADTLAAEASPPQPLPEDSFTEDEAVLLSMSQLLNNRFDRSCMVEDLSKVTELSVARLKSHLMRMRFAGLVHFGPRDELVTATGVGGLRAANLLPDLRGRSLSPENRIKLDYLVGRCENHYRRPTALEAATAFADQQRLEHEAKRLPRDNIDPEEESRASSQTMQVQAKSSAEPEAAPSRRVGNVRSGWNWLDAVILRHPTWSKIAASAIIGFILFAVSLFSCDRNATRSAPASSPVPSTAPALIGPSPTTSS